MSLNDVLGAMMGLNPAATDPGSVWRDRYADPVRDYPPNDPRRFSSVPGILGPRRAGGIGSDYAQGGGSYPVRSYPIVANTGGGIGSDYAGSRSRSRYADPQVAAMQRDLNSRGAHLTVDGIRGPLTMAAERQYANSSIQTARIPQARPEALAWSPQIQAINNRIAGAFGAAAQPEVQQLGNPYMDSTGGASAIQTARLPQPRPAYPGDVASNRIAGAFQLANQVPQLTMNQFRRPVLAGVPLMYAQAPVLNNAAAAAASQAGGSSRSGMGYSGGGYQGGSYGGFGGGSINQGVGGSFKNR